MQALPSILNSTTLPSNAFKQLVLIMNCVKVDKIISNYLL